ncbi:MAG: thiamine pyrophosphate-dependent enzyme, partial [Bacillota bacterium]
GTDVTVVVLDNRTTAMTGHQPHPGLGRTASGNKAPAINIAAIARACGAGLVMEADPYNLGEAQAAIRQAVLHPGPAVVVLQRECVALVRSQKRCAVDSQACLACGQCVEELGCPALERQADGTVQTGAGCHGCGVCTQVCPAEAIQIKER